MPSVMCPHCHTDGPLGAKACRDCQAEIEYGASPALPLFIVLVAGFLGWKTGVAPHSILGWLAFSGLAGGGLYGCMRVFRDRVNLKRIYRTK